jgi:hypothetical protein
MTTTEIIQEIDRIIGELEALKAQLEQPDYATDDLTVLARAMAGEGAALFGPDRDKVARWIGHAAINYWETNWWMVEDMLKAMLANEPERLIRALNALSQNDRAALREIVTLADVTAYRYHGTANVKGKPPEWAIKIAAQVLHRESDITHGAMFMLSGNDLKNLSAWDRRDEAIHRFAGPKGHEFYFFRLWVG